ncbi:TlpA family protein disulfide reductase [Roseivirga echinicomitans]
MNKKVISKLIIGVVVLVAGILIVGLAHKLKERDILERNQQAINLNGVEYLGTTLPEKGDIILVLFHPSCDFCQTDAQFVKEQIDQFKNIDLIWVSYDNKDSIAQFSKTYELDNLENVHFAYMDIEVMLERYGNVKFPTFLAYDKNGALLQKFVGVTKPEELLSVYDQE